MKKTSICAVFLFIFATFNTFGVEFGDIEAQYPLLSAGDPFAITVATNTYRIATNNSARITANDAKLAAESNRIDVIRATYVPYTGSASNLNLGAHSVIADTFAPNTNYTATGSETLGTTHWDEASKTLVIVYPNGQNLNVGEETCVAVQNDTGATITNGMTVMWVGEIGNSGNIRVAPAYVTTSTDVHRIIGMATTDIPDGAVGKVTVRGKVRGIRTNGGNVGETWVNANEVYVTTNQAYAGYCTTNKPPAPYPAIRVAKVVAAHANNGAYLVAPEYPCRITDLIDVDGTPLTTTGQFPMWDMARGVFDFNRNYVTDLAGKVTTDRTITINGAVGTLSSNLTFIVEGGIDAPTATNIAQAVIAPYTNAIETAWQNPSNASDFTKTSDGSQITITGYTGTGGAVVIPDMLDGLPVTAIGDYAFYNNAVITSISGGNSVKSIGTHAFRYCTSLTSVSLPNVTSISDYAFYECTSLTSVSLPSATSIGASVFSVCTSLPSLSLPNVTSISDYAFYGCTSLTSVSLPSATSIGASVFSVCTSLTSVSLPSATSIGAYAFYGCTSLASVYWGQNQPTEQPDLYLDANQVANYVTNPTATGWGSTFGDRPVVRMPVATDSLTVAGTNLTTYLDAKLSKAGDTATGSIYSTVDHTATAPADNEFPTAKWVRGLAMSGAEWYFTSTVTNGFGEKTANFVSLASVAPVDAFTNVIASPLTSSTYLAGGITTNTYTALRSPITVDAWVARTGGTLASVIPVYPEIYYVYNGSTNHLGDWSVAPQLITETTPARKEWVVAFPEPTITGAVKVIAYLKTGTISGPAARLNIYGGNGYTSHIDIQSINVPTETDPVYEADLANGVLTVPADLIVPYKAFTGTITPANGTATVTYAVGNMPSLTITSPTVITLDPTSYGTSGVSRVSLNFYSGTNSVTLATNVITYATAPTISTNQWNTILIRRVSDSAWKGVGL